VTPVSPCHLFEVYGVEIEYMIVDAATFDVRPIADSLLASVGGADPGVAGPGEICWSNELALHVVELKADRPAPALEALLPLFDAHVAAANRALRTLDARLLPGAMHPWMDPLRETKLWPHEYAEVYGTFDRIFGCRGHGWSNLQSVHLNLPFADDEEFGRLHAAIRLVLPLLPALAAASPIVEGRPTGILDNRLAFYRENSAKVPSVTGHVIPEAVFTPDAYGREILARIYADLAPHDPAGVLRHEWANARGAIARFDRSAIEIRLLDAQECPAADLAVCAAAAEVIRSLAEERWCDQRSQKAWAVEPLDRILRATTRDGEAAMIHDAEYLRAFGWQASSCTAGRLWRHLLDTGPGDAIADGLIEPLQVILDRGPLARRILRAAGPQPSHADLLRICRCLAECLASGRAYDPA